MTTGAEAGPRDYARAPRRLPRDAFGEAILELGEKDPRVVLLAADLGRMVSYPEFSLKYPSRAYNLGVAEQNMMGVAAGLASFGLIPFATTCCAFATLRALEQLRNDAAYTGFNVKVGGVYSGITMGAGGSTHHSTEDFGVLRSIPGVTILAPADAPETYRATLAAVDWPGPVYIRLGGREPDPLVYEAEHDFAIGKAIVLREGSDLTIAATGSMVFPAMWAADVLRSEGIRARLLNVHTIKPMDADAIGRAARETGRILTVEEHNAVGGLGSAVADVAVASCPVPVRMLGLPDRFLSVGPVNQLRARFGLSREGIVEEARRFLKGRPGCRT
jgi:transketolase